MKKHTHRRRIPASMFESLEKREFLSASSTTAHPDTAFATTTALYVSSRSVLIGQTVTVKGVVASSGGTPKGTVELLDDGKDTGLTGTLNHKGYYVFTLDAGQAAFAGTHLYRIRYLSAGSFIGSKSRQLIAKTFVPKLTTASDGLEVATVVAGTGAGATSGQTLNVQYTEFDASNGALLQSSDQSSSTFSFVLDGTVQPVIAGFDQEATGMKVGEVRVAVLPSALAYGTGDQVFVIHLVSIS